ncbi:MAG TPA: Type 1 glutamine amidotransferase-like domain-containing protein [Thermoanaerobaculia bacterium]|nr:Type 1 glutamine amidotransferase-like domain-containing protein [Thermoanaerobaculia bacterium]
MSTIKPIFLLADSQLLFWRDSGELFLGQARALLDADEERAGRAPKAAYLGASNGDAPEFYHLFVAAMEQIGIRDCRHIPTQPAAEDLDFLAGADLILLAGGEVRRGWDAFKAAGLDQKLVERYYGGALLFGVSAGAVQLGLKGWDETGAKTSDMLRVVPFVVDVHDEPGWAHLLQAVPRAGEHARGIGIPSGGGALYHPDYSVEPVRHPLVEVSQTESGLQQALLLPGQASAPAAGTEAAGGGGAAAAAADADSPAAGGGTGGSPSPERRHGGAEAADLDRERSDLGYSIGADGVIELRRPEDPKKEPVN